jgi:hypothetical protein
MLLVVCEHYEQWIQEQERQAKPSKNDSRAGCETRRSRRTAIARMRDGIDAIARTLGPRSIMLANRAMLMQQHHSHSAEVWRSVGSSARQ